MILIKLLVFFLQNSCNNFIKKFLLILKLFNSLLIKNSKIYNKKTLNKKKNINTLIKNKNKNKIKNILALFLLLVLIVKV